MKTASSFLKYFLTQYPSEETLITSPTFKSMLTGEEIYIYLRANAVNSNIKLSSPDFRCEDTFMGLQTKATFFIENNSEITTKFYWKQFELAPEGSQGVRRQSVYSNREHIPEPPGEMIEAALEQVLVNDACNTAYQIEEDLLKFQEGPDHLFHNDNFNVYPLFGEVKPNSKTEIHLVFAPNNCAFFEGIAYLDISGLEKRLPFKFYGRGLGPKFRIAFEVLSVGDVTMGGTHTYELPVMNVSEIPGTMQCNGQVGLPTGMEMKVEPLFLDVAPGAYGAFYVNFLCSGKPGPFEDEIKFSAKDTGDAFYVTVK
ncbi:unnamed protein product [Orchesella dallaii]|uniref:Hydrocephalus-inducing protein n=1 Tax=Orchesella dallaii TaxID=48710 RepID=A0ABP1QJH0_9HEXA